MAVFGLRLKKIVDSSLNPPKTCEYTRISADQDLFYIPIQTTGIFNQIFMKETSLYCKKILILKVIFSTSSLYKVGILYASLVLKAAADSKSSSTLIDLLNLDRLLGGDALEGLGNVLGQSGQSHTYKKLKR